MGAWAERTDEFLGDNDYSKKDLALRIRYKYSTVTNVIAKIRSTTIGYDKAYSFDDVVRGEKESSGLDLALRVEHKRNKHKKYYLELEHTDHVSMDDRYDYTNNVIMLGAKWQY